MWPWKGGWNLQFTNIKKVHKSLVSPLNLLCVYLILHSAFLKLLGWEQEIWHGRWWQVIVRLYSMWVSNVNPQISNLYWAANWNWKWLVQLRRSRYQNKWDPFALSGGGCQCCLHPLRLTTSCPLGQLHYSHQREATEALKQIQSLICKLQNFDFLIPLMSRWSWRDNIVVDSGAPTLAVCSTESACTPTSQVNAAVGVSGPAAIWVHTCVSGRVRCSTHSSFLKGLRWVY